MPILPISPQPITQRHRRPHHRTSGPQTRRVPPVLEAIEIILDITIIAIIIVVILITISITSVVVIIVILAIAITILIITVILNSCCRMKAECRNPPPRTRRASAPLPALPRRRTRRPADSRFGNRRR